MPKERELGSSVSTVAVNNDSGTAISPVITGLIKSSVAESIGALTYSLTQVIEDRLGSFASRYKGASRKLHLEKKVKPTAAGPYRSSAGRI